MLESCSGCDGFVGVTGVGLGAGVDFGASAGLGVGPGWVCA